MVTKASRLSLFLGLLCSLMLLIAIEPAIAHHPFGGQTPTNFLQGFLSGLGHPIIGPDHFVFVIAVGLLASLKASNGMMIPVSFVGATLLGTVIHLQSLDLPGVELIISASVIACGIMLAMKQSPTLIWLTGLGVLAGIFHGYAYGEAIVGAEMTPLVAYLMGFAAIQLIVSLLAFFGGTFLRKQLSDPSSQSPLSLRFAGFTILGVGMAFASSVLLG